MGKVWIIYFFGILSVNNELHFNLKEEVDHYPHHWEGGFLDWSQQPGWNALQVGVNCHLAVTKVRLQVEGCQLWFDRERDMLHQVYCVHTTHKWITL